jgi:hypothetical protein
LRPGTFPETSGQFDALANDWHTYRNENFDPRIKPDIEFVCAENRAPVLQATSISDA